MTLIPMERMRKIGLTTLVAGSILVGSGAVFAQDSNSTPTTQTTSSETTSRDSSPAKNRPSSDDRGRSSGMNSQLASAEISPADAVAAATTEIDGAVVAFGTGEVDSEPAYFVQIDDQLVTVSAMDGTVLDTQTVQRRGSDSRMGERDHSDQNGDEAETDTENESETDASTPIVTTSETTASQPTDLETLLLTATVSPAEAASIAETETGDSAQSLELRRHDGAIVYVVRAENSEVVVDATNGDIWETTIRTIYISSDETMPNEPETGTPAA